MLSVVMVLLASGVSAQNQHNGHAYVDLGLSVKWATCNVGADSPEHYGDYYAWGETATKSSYYASNSVTWKQDVGDISGAPQYDAATAKWGGDWRMPTLEEFNELQNSCTWEWTTCGGVKGYKVISKVNGNAIFLPVAGYYAEESLEGAGVRGMYWVSTPAKEGTQYAYNFYFDSGYKCAYWISRADGHSLRPVLNIDSDDESKGSGDSGKENSGDNLADKESNAKSSQKGGSGQTESENDKSKIAESMRDKSLKEESEKEESIKDKSVEEESEKAGFAQRESGNRESSGGDSTNEEPQKGVSVKVGTEKTVSEDTHNGYVYVDLGLSTKWAACNVGAESPEQYGDYYAWGEIATKSTYTEDTYVADNNKNEDIKGTNFDVARAKWGGRWCMPTKADFEELVNKCRWEWTTQNGNSGYKVTGPNGNSIFLPVAGYRYGGSRKSAGMYGYYWSSTPCAEEDNAAYYLHIKGSNSCTNSVNRSFGHTIRPVLE